MIELDGTGLLAPRSVIEARSATVTLSEQDARQITNTVSFLQERLVELEDAIDGWDRLEGNHEREFSREGLRRIMALSRLMFLKNPLINRAVTIQAFYVFGQGVTIQAAHPDVNDVVQTFLDDVKNKAELTAHQTRTETEQTLQVEGNIFFVLFTNPTTGRVRIRTIPVDELDDIIANPDDAREPWYYKRTWTQIPLSGTGVVRQTAYYPDWRYHPSSRPPILNGVSIERTTPVYHVRVGGLKGMRFGVPETYAALDWARAYKSFLENWATITQAYARFAFKATTPGGARGVAAAKTRLSTTIGHQDRVETNPPPVAGATFITAAGSGTDLTPIKTAGATTRASDGRNLLLMVAAATGLPEFFFGDANVGNHATAKTLDRPTELKFTDRQTLWSDVLRDILGYVVDQSVLAPKGKLTGTVGKDDEGDRIITLETDAKTGEPIDRNITVTFPPILEHDQGATIGAIVSGLTLDGKKLVLDSPEMLELELKLVFQALGIQDADEVLDRLLPKDAEGKLLPLPKPEPSTPPTAPGSPVSPTGGSQPPDPAQPPTEQGQQPATEAVSEATAPYRPLSEAPEDDEPVTAEDLAAIREGREAYARGEYVTDDGLAEAISGRPLDLRPDELGAMATVAPEDLARARALWNSANDGSGLEGLLDAGVDE